MLKNARIIFILLAVAGVTVESLLYISGTLGPVASAETRLKESIAVLMLIALAMYPVFISATRIIVQRIKAIIQGLDRIQAGNYSTDINLAPMRWPFSPEDELDRIVQGINRMQLEVAKREQQLLFKQESMEGMLQLLTRQADELRTNYEIYKIISEETNDGMIQLDYRTQRLTAIQTKKILGYEPEDFDDTFSSWMSLVHPEDQPLLESAFTRHLKGETPLIAQEYRMQAKDGSWHWFATRLKSISKSAGVGPVLVGSSTYIETWKQAKESIYRLAYYNQVSGLPNRSAFLEALDQRIQVFNATSRGFALFLVNLDRFKRINELAGHEAGDHLIRQVADSLRKIIGPSDFLGHINGDEFVLLAEVKDCRDTEMKVQALVNLFKYSWSVEERSFHITASVGVAACPGDSREGRELLKKADLALADAKEAGGNVGRIYLPAMNMQLQEKIEIENALRKAVENDEFHVYYQPQLSENGTITGFEALIRWLRPSGEVVPPSVFIPSAEETGLIVEMGDIVLGQVCRMAVALREEGFGDLTFSVNLSPVQFDDGRLVEKIRLALQQYGVRPSQLIMEITESLAMENFNYVSEVLRQMKELGIRVALDDFGKGYSSLNYLKRLDIDTLKVDRDFIRDIGRDRDDEIILDHIIGIAREMKLLVVAEGVETIEQFNYLKQRQCNEYQGFLFSRPVPAEQVLPLLRRGIPVLQDTV